MEQNYSDMAEGTNIPPENDGDYLTRIRRSIAVARDFKGLVITLASGDKSGHSYFGEDLQNADLDEDGRFAEHFQLSHGHYDITPSKDVPEIDPVVQLDATIDVARPEGGRVYRLGSTSLLRSIIEIAYYEDMPLKPGVYTGSEDIYSRFQLDTQLSSGIGVDRSDLEIIRLFTQNTKVAQQAGRLLVSSECRCF